MSERALGTFVRRGSSPPSLEGLSRRQGYAIGGVLLLLLGGGFMARKKLAIAFRLVRNAYETVEEWAADRGQQLRDAFGVSPDPLKPEGSIKSSSMSADEWNRRKINTLVPAAQPRFRAFLSDVQAVARRHGAEIIIWDAARTLERQVDLYKRGRTVPGSIVTYAIATVTGHIWGLAVDLIFRTPAGEPSWGWPPGSQRTPRWYYDEVLPLAAKHKLESLYLKVGKDPPHIQMPTSEATVTVAAASAIKGDFPGLA